MTRVPQRESRCQVALSTNAGSFRLQRERERSRGVTGATVDEKRVHRRRVQHYAPLETNDAQTFHQPEPRSENADASGTGHDDGVAAVPLINVSFMVTPSVKHRR
jgi:hypothetical protein